MLRFVDVTKAHLSAKCDEEEWVELPDEFRNFGRYAKLQRWLYGMRKAASGWEDDDARRLVEDGFRRGRAASTKCFHSKTHVRVVVHGYDFTFAGTESELKKIQPKMLEWYDVQGAQHSWQRQAGRARDRNIGQIPDVDRRRPGV